MWLPVLRHLLPQPNGTAAAVATGAKAAVDAAAASSSYTDTFSVASEKQGAEFHLINLRGHGGRAAPPSGNGAHCVADATADVLAFVDSLSRGVGGTTTTATATGGGAAAATTLIGVGHSLGASALLNAELERPGTFDYLVVIEPVLGPAGDTAAMQQIYAEHSVGPGSMSERTRNRRAVWDSPATARVHFGRGMCRGWDDEALDMYVKHGTKRLQHGAEGGSTGSGDASGTPRDGAAVTLQCTPAYESGIYTKIPWNIARDAAQIQAKVLFLAAANSKHLLMLRGGGDVSLTAMYNEIAETMPNASVQEMPEGTHFLVQEFPADVAHTVDQLLHSVSGDAGGSVASATALASGAPTSRL